MILYKVNTYIQIQSGEINKRLHGKWPNEIWVLANTETEAIDMCCMECERLGIETKGRVDFFSVTSIACNPEDAYANKMLINKATQDS